jgi:saccharopine dehydrogenase (NAD+, L-lysine forming)
MNQRVAFGVIGGYGGTGKNAVAELWKSCPTDILIGGRDADKAGALAAQFDSRVSAARVDVLDASSLDDFCQRCSIIVNCTSPVMDLQDRVAQAALRARCHYVDAASLMTVKEGILPHSQAINDAGLSFVISAGWFPGISEILPLYADTLARTKMEAVECSTVYFGDTSAWSENAMREAAWLIRRLGESRRGFYRNGKWVRVGLFGAARKVDLGSPLGHRQCYLFSNPEFSEVGARLTDCTLSSYGCLPGWRIAVASTLITLLPISDKLGGRLLRHAFRKNRLPVGGFIIVHVEGRSRGCKQALRIRFTYQDGREYWVNGVVPATVARMICEGRVQAGVQFLASAVDPLAFVTELRKAGMDLSENFELQGIE